MRLFVVCRLGSTNYMWTGAVDIVIVNVVGRSVSHTLTWVVRPVHCVVWYGGKHVDLVSLAP